MAAFAIGGGGYAGEGAELAGEEEDVVVAELGGDGFDGEGGFGEESAGGGDA